MKIYRVPGFRKLCFYRGSVAYEVQAGPLVIQWFYQTPPPQAGYRRLHVWRDDLWRGYTKRQRYLHYAPWGV